MKIPGLPNKSYSRSDAAQIAAKKYKTSATRIYQIWKMQGEIKQQPLRGARAHWLLFLQNNIRNTRKDYCKKMQNRIPQHADQWARAPRRYCQTISKE